jgi:Sap, sulfolipid-1-addressing protein
VTTVGDVFLLAFAAALNPTLVAASTLMMMLPNPKRLMLGYLLGALMTSITLGLVIVFSLEGTSAVGTAQNTVSPAATITLGAIALTAALVLGTGRHARAAARRRARKRDKAPPRWQRALEKGSPRTTFVVGALLTLPGASYLAGLSRIDKLNYPTASTVALVVGFNLIMLALLEVPLLCFAIAPNWTTTAIDRAKDWLTGHAHRFAVTGLAVVGGLLVTKGLIELLS